MFAAPEIWTKFFFVLFLNRNKGGRIRRLKRIGSALTKLSKNWVPSTTRISVV